MGLQLTLTKNYNHLNYDFIDAYWCIDNITYTSGNTTFFSFRAYPSREAKLINKTLISDQLSFGGATNLLFDTCIYFWDGACSTSTIFPNGIPLDEDAQKTAIYNYIKQYTGLPFTDVFEEGQQST